MIHIKPIYVGLTPHQEPIQNTASHYSQITMELLLIHIETHLPVHFDIQTLNISPQTTHRQQQNQITQAQLQFINQYHYQIKRVMPPKVKNI